NLRPTPWSRGNSWVGFFHQTTEEFIECGNTWERSPLWTAVRRRTELQTSCRGLFVLTQQQQRFLQPWFSCPIVFVKHPARLEPEVRFTWERFLAAGERRVVMTGCWQRRFDDLDRLAAPGFTKYILSCYADTSAILSDAGIKSLCLTRRSDAA